MLFLDPTEPELATLVDLTAQYIRTLTAFFFPLALVNIVRFSIQGMGFSGPGVLEMIARTAVGVIFVPMFGYTAACFASPAAWVCADLFLIPACMGSINRLRKFTKKRTRSLRASGSLHRQSRTKATPPGRFSAQHRPPWASTVFEQWPAPGRCRRCPGCGRGRPGRRVPTAGAAPPGECWGRRCTR